MSRAATFPIRRHRRPTAFDLGALMGALQSVARVGDHCASCEHEEYCANAGYTACASYSRAVTA